jgi:eukaryotic-like serine/threonine-protein kinase
VTNLALDPTAAELTRLLAGEYRLDREIARGGMGVVYLAVDERLARRVAIKTLHPSRAGDAAMRARFLREARTAAALTHANIVPIHQAAEREGMAWFVMGYVDGESLAERIAREGCVEARPLAAIMADVADALSYAHALGIVHRDIKAENVLLDRATGRALVTDFGIARVTESTPLTATGAVLGTVQYMSPEQVAGEALDGRSDLYALGVMAYLGLTGRFPFERPTAPAILLAHVRDPVPALDGAAPDAPSWLRELVMRLLEKSARDRPADAGTVATLLREGYAFAAAVAAGRARAPAIAAPRLATVEAEAVWARAARLQAETDAALERPDFPVAPSPLATGAGYARADVRDAAVGAGIPAPYVDRALAEREAARREVALPTQAPSKIGRALAGAPLQAEFECEIAHELTDDELEELVDIARRTFDDIGQVSVVGRSLTYVTSPPVGGRASSRRGQVVVLKRNGRTVVRVTESMGPLAGALFGGIMGGAGGGLAAGVVGAVLGATQQPGLAAAGVVALLGASYGLARVIFVSKAHQRIAALRRMVDTLAAQFARD